MPREGPESSGALFLSCPGDKPAFLFQIKVAQSCQTLCDPMDSVVHGILQARILEWVAYPSPADLPDPAIEPGSPALQVDSLPTEL